MEKLKHVECSWGEIVRLGSKGLTKDEKKNSILMSSKIIHRDVSDGLRLYIAQLIKVDNRYKLNRIDTNDDNAKIATWYFGNHVYLNNNIEAFRAFKKLCSDPSYIEKYVNK